ncbi:MAG: ABC transporter permease [Acidimicrobiales bacterium]|nr:ABC transporter permease [Acidimicrobiales bacterium]
MHAMVAQTRNELVLSLRQGEQLLVSMGIPVLVLLFLSQVDILPTGTERPIDFLAPAVLGLAVMSSSMVSLGIGTGFERHYGVLKRLGATPLGRPRLLAAKIASVVATEVVQLAMLSGVALALGWQPAWSVLPFAGAVLLGTAAFAGTGLLLAGRLSGPANLAACNGLYLVLLLFGGVAVPASELPGPLGGVAGVLPTGALVKVLRSATGATLPVTGAWIALLAWAVAMPLAAALTFRWSPAD